MQTRYAIIAALPREVVALVGRLRADQTLVRRGIHLYRLGSAVVVAGGMGAERATLAVAAALEVAPDATLISAGLAGACRPDVRAGEVMEAGVVVDALTGERFAARNDASEVLVTTRTIASVAEKARLAATYGAAMVDMEAAAVARLAQARGLDFRAIKGISDAHDFELQSLAKFSGKFGGFRTGAFALHIALHPREWGKAVTLGRCSQQALDKLANRLQDMIESVA